MVMAVIQDNLKEPGAVRLPFHRMRIRMPVVEVPDYRHLFCFGSVAVKVDRDGNILC